MPTQRADHVSILLADGRVLVAGGDNDCAGGERKSAAAELYDPTTGTFSSTGPLNVPRAHFTAVRLSDGRVFAVGGDNDASGFLASAEIYDPATDAWTLVSSMQSGRFFPLGDGAVLLADGRVLVAPSAAGSETYDPASDAWTPFDPFNDPTHGAGAMSQLADGRALVVSGFRTGGFELDLTWTAEIYTP
jgi:hypothetical protein